MSLALVGNNSLIFILRILTSIELFCNAEFYLKHPVMVKFFEDHGQDLRIKNYNDLIDMVLPHESTDDEVCRLKMIEKEALLNCKSNRWGCFMEILALASVIRTKLITHYPDFGLIRWRKLFNQSISPRLNSTSHNEIHLLFCHQGFEETTEFKHNHYVPIGVSVRQKKGVSVNQKLQVSVNQKSPVSPNQNSVVPVNQKSAGSSKQKLSKKQKFKQVVDNETPNFSSSSKQRKLLYWLSPTGNSPIKKEKELINSSVVQFPPSMKQAK